jgi:8-oxo-dGTP diphosphatase
VIEAAGGVVWRTTAHGRLKVLLVHRPRYDDWSFPKGKLFPGEDALTAALREVREETGLTCEVGIHLPEVVYVDRKHRQKRVRYWAMQPVNGHFRANDEVDTASWLRVEDAAERLSYEHDRPVLDRIFELLVAA